MTEVVLEDEGRVESNKDEMKKTKSCGENKLCDYHDYCGDCQKSIQIKRKLAR